MLDLLSKCTNCWDNIIHGSEMRLRRTSTENAWHLVSLRIGFGFWIESSLSRISFALFCWGINKFSSWSYFECIINIDNSCRKFCLKLRKSEEIWTYFKVKNNINTLGSLYAHIFIIHIIYVQCMIIYMHVCMFVYTPMYLNLIIFEEKMESWKRTLCYWPQVETLPILHFIIPRYIINSWLCNLQVNIIMYCILRCSFVETFVVIICCF